MERRKHCIGILDPNISITSNPVISALINTVIEMSDKIDELSERINKLEKGKAEPKPESYTSLVDMQIEKHPEFYVKLKRCADCAYLAETDSTNYMECDCLKHNYLVKRSDMACDLFKNI